MDKNKIKEIFNLLKRMYPNAKSELNYSTNFELLVAVILSAQCTDKRVNIITSELFKEYNTPKAIGTLPPEKLENLIKSCGLYKSKTVHLIKCSKQILEKFNGEVPNNLNDLISLSGVGRKTANVILAVAFKKPAIAVDTHVFRVANRIGLTNSKSVDKCEQQLNKVLDKQDWINAHFILVLFGRYHCTARNPNCSKCKINKFCKYYNKVVKKDVCR
ncbi:MAG: endonuclease III [Clostridia bacterium]|jgi:endonuclease-3|nr:endonuclease III [Clostridia bacterium]MDD4275971.1 endonuclease III [Clostridia bacterium]